MKAPRSAAATTVESTSVDEGRRGPGRAQRWLSHPSEAMSNSAKPWEQSPTSTTLGDSHSSSTEASVPAPHRPSRASREIAGLTGDYSLTRSESSTSAPDADGNFFSVALDDFSIHGLVGEGEFGKVMMATKKDTGQLYAMKVLRKERQLLRGKTSSRRRSPSEEAGALPAPVHRLAVLRLPGPGATLPRWTPRAALISSCRSSRSSASSRRGSRCTPARWCYARARPCATRPGLQPECDGRTDSLQLNDFGSAPASAARTGTICGTPEYLAPEVLQGMPTTAPSTGGPSAVSPTKCSWASRRSRAATWRAWCSRLSEAPCSPPAAPPRLPRALPAHLRPAAPRRRLDLPTWLSGGAVAIVLLERKPAQRLGSRPLPTPPPCSRPARRRRTAHAFFGRDWRALYEKAGAAAERAAQPEHGRRRIEPPGLRRLRDVAAAVKTLARIRLVVVVGVDGGGAVGRDAIADGDDGPNTPLINDRLGRSARCPPGSGSPPTPGPTSASTSRRGRNSAMDALARSN